MATPTPQDGARPRRPVPPGHEKIGRLTLPVNVAAILRARAEVLGIAPIALAREVLAAWALGLPPTV